MRALLEHLIDAVERNQSLLELNLGDLTEEEASVPAGRGGNSAHWVVGHIVYWRDAMLVTLGADAILDADSASEFEGLHLGEAPRHLSLTFPQVKDRAGEGARRLVEGLKGLDGGGPGPSLHKVARLVLHEAYHVGQLGILRRVLGKPGVVGVPR